MTDRALGLRRERVELDEVEALDRLRLAVLEDLEVVGSETLDDLSISAPPDTRPTRTKRVPAAETPARCCACVLSVLPCGDGRRRPPPTCRVHDGNRDRNVEQVTAYPGVHHRVP
jgi:hypothetical protein